MHLRSVAAKSWMKIKAGPTPHRSSQPVIFLSDYQGACSPAQAPILLQIALAARCQAPLGHIRGVHHHICTRTRMLNILMSLAGATLCSSSAVLYYPPQTSCRAALHTQAALVYTQARRTWIHTGVTSQSKSVIILWSNTSQY